MDSGQSAWTARPAEATGPSDWFSARAAAEALGISQRTIRRAIVRGDLPARKQSGVFRIAPADVAAFGALLPRTLPVRAAPSSSDLERFPTHGTAIASALPLWHTPLVGREGEVAALVELLSAREASLVTLCGPGGVGKSRLAACAATTLAPAFPDGVRFVPLASVRDPAQVAPTILRAFGGVESPQRTPMESLALIVGTRRILLVLDNLEHLLSEAPLVADVLAACPRLAVLATSRVRLNLSAEQEFPVRPLPLPNPPTGEEGLSPDLDAVADAAAVRLFVSRAKAIDPSFRLSAANAGAIAVVCAAVDGLPLAIELAAAQTRLFSPRALAARMERRLPLLTGGPRDHPDRHRTMRDSIAWSYELLADNERSLFRQLAVFVGGFRLAAAEAINGDGEPGMLAGVAALVDHQLLGRADGPDGEPRFTMLETIREYALDRLVEGGEAHEVRRRHAVHFLELAERAEPALRGPDQIVWFDALEAEIANLRDALSWLGDSGDSSDGLRLAAAMWTFWVVRDRVPEGRRWLEGILPASAAGTAPRTRALVALGDLAERQGDYDIAATRLDEALALANANGDRAGEIAALRVLASVATSLGHAARVRMDPEKAAEELARAERLLERSLALAREADDAWAMARATHLLGLIPQDRGDTTTAMARFDEAIDDFRRLGDHRQVCMIAGNIGGLAVAAGDFERARAALAESIGLAKILGYRWWIGICLNELGHVASRTGDHARAATLLGAAGAIRSAAGAPLRAGPQRDQDSTIADITAALGAEATAEMLRQGAALPLREVVAEAEALCAVSSPRRPMGRSRRADSVATAKGMAGISTRERDVLRLLVEGRTDREIAEALFIGARTVRAHVASILAKLDAPTRTAAATIAVRRGLV